MSFGVDRPEDEFFIGGPGIGMAGSSSSSSLLSRCFLILAGFIVLLGYYIRQVTRPRFRLPRNTVGKRPQVRNPDEERGSPQGLIGDAADLDPYGDIERRAL